MDAQGTVKEGIGNGRTTSERLLSSLFLISVFLLAITKIENTDTWTHLSFGRWIWEHRAIPGGEPFIPIGNPFPYQNWLFGSLFYAAYRLYQFPGVILLKALVITTAFGILLKDSLRPHRNYALALFVLTFIVIMTRHRFVVRPDIFLMVFLSFSIFSLNAYLSENRKFLYALPLTHLLWANSHTSLPLMFIPFCSFLAGGLIQRFLVKRGLELPGTPSDAQLRTIAVIFFASFVASLMSPYTIHQYTQGAEALSVSWWKQEVAELKRPTTWEVTWWIYLLSGATIGSFVLNRRRISLIHLFLVLPFIVLAFSAMRFIFLLGIIAGPVLIRNISSFIESKFPGDIFSRRVVVTGVACWMVLYATLALTKTVRYIDPEERKDFGFGVNYSYIPEGALTYMDKQGITGRVFNTFQRGGYITWRDFPKRVPLIDGRGFRDGSLLDRMALALRQKDVLDDFERTYHFDSILIDYPLSSVKGEDIFSGRDVALTHPGWALVYWDDSALLYLKRGGPFDPVIQRDEYRRMKPANGPTALRPWLHDREYRKDLIMELTRNIRETDAVLPRLFLGFVYNEIGLFPEAIKVFGEALEKPWGKKAPVRVTSYKGIAYACLSLGRMKDAIEYYEKTLSIREDADARYNLGIIYAGMGEKERAAAHLEQALKLNESLESAYPLLIGIYENLGKSKERMRVMKAWEAARSKVQGEEHFQRGLKAYLSRDYEEALREFGRSLEVYPLNPVAYSNMGYVYYDMDMMERAYEFQRRAVDMDPKYANAYYGLALVYKRWGDKTAAKRHWEEYLKIEPSGYFSRKAAEEIALIDKGE